MYDTSHIRNFCIIAHIDHGKSTLADRLLELTGTVPARKMHSQFLDQMDIERERGITIKMQPVRMIYFVNHAPIFNSQFSISNENLLKIKNLKIENSNSEYILNLIDTPGHIDFTYEVSRALLAVEGAILLVDATQGVQAQTITNLELAKRFHLAVVPVMNKIDLPDARIEETKAEIVALLSCDPDDILLVSAKTGEGVGQVLRAIIDRIPPPSFWKTSDVLGTSDVEEKRVAGAFQALIFDSKYSTHKGVLAYVRVFSGSFLPHRGATLHLVHKNITIEPVEVGVFLPELRATEGLHDGEIGYIATNIKDPEIVRVGDTIGAISIGTYQEPKAMAWASIFPSVSDEFKKLKDAIVKLKLNDPALSYETEGSALFGRSMRAGFLGMLHLEITIERLRREFGVSVVVAHPTVEYQVVDEQGAQRAVRDPVSFENIQHPQRVCEPWFLVSIVSRVSDLGAIMELLKLREGEVVETQTLPGERIVLSALMPLRKLITHFFDDLKSVTQGYGSLSYEFGEMRIVDLTVLSVFIGEKAIPQFARLLPKGELEREARKTVERLYEILPRQLFALKIQAGIGSRILASRTLPALSKHVTAKLYGGDRSRKMKLWKKQKEGKKRLEAHGDVDIPHEVYLKMIKN